MPLSHMEKGKERMLTTSGSSGVIESGPSVVIENRCRTLSETPLLADIFQQLQECIRTLEMMLAEERHFHLPAMPRIAAATPITNTPITAISATTTPIADRPISTNTSPNAMSITIRPQVPEIPITATEPPPAIPTKLPVKLKMPKLYNGKEGTLRKFLFQMDKFLRPYKNVDKDEKLSALVLCLEESILLDWWFEKRSQIQTWTAAKEALWNRYSDQFVKANAYWNLEALQQTGRIQDYLAEVDRLNSHVKIPEDILMDLIMRKI